MKKLISILLIIIVMFSLVACNTEPQLSPEEIQKQIEEEKVQNVEDLIDSIVHKLSPDYLTTIQAAQSAYDELDDNLKELVNNYEKLIRAQKIYKWNNIQKNAISKATSELRSELKYPPSLTKNNEIAIIFYDKNLENPLFVQVSISYSAMNSFGGYKNGHWFSYFEVTENGTLNKITIYEYSSKSENTIPVYSDSIF